MKSRWTFDMFGTVTLSYTPSSITSSDSSITMSFSSEADIVEMMSNFGNFLRAMGYPMDFGDCLVISRESDNE
jgi:hypothetical protein